MSKYTICFILLFLSVAIGTTAQTSRSLIYDAVALMNARRGLNAFTLNGKTVVNTSTWTIDPNATDPSGYLDSPALSKAIGLSILARYAHLSASTPPDPVAIKAAYAGNPFLDGTFTPDANPYPHQEYPGFAPSQPLTTDANNIFGNLVNGTADFLIQRAADELSISIFQKLQGFLANYPELDTLFPKTCALIKPVPAYDYNKTLQAFKDAIQQDLQGLLARVPLLYHIPKYQLLNDHVPSLTLAFAAADLIADIQAKHSVVWSLTDLGNAAFLKQQNNYASLLNIACILSNSLRAKLPGDADDGDYPYIDKAFLINSTNIDASYVDELALIYLGLLYQQIAPIQFSAGNATYNVGDLLSRWKGNHQQAFNTVMKSISVLQQADAALAVIKKAGSKRNGKYRQDKYKNRSFPLVCNHCRWVFGLGAGVSGSRWLPGYADGGPAYR